MGVFIMHRCMLPQQGGKIVTYTQVTGTTEH